MVAISKSLDKYQNKPQRMLVQKQFRRKMLRKVIHKIGETTV